MMREFVAVLLGAACFADEKMKLGPLGALYVLDGDVQVPVDEHRHGDALGAFSWLDTKRFLWPGGKMRYVIATDFTDPGLPADHYLTEDDENINWALQHISNNTCVEFIKCDSFDTCQSPFVCFQSSTGCNSHVGMLSWEKRFQAINLSPACGPGAVTHEIFHALGFQHTGMRSDRDEYLSIDYEAGTPPTTEPYGRIINPFDYKSIMHTVESGLSPGDVDSLHFIYNECSEVFTAPTCRSSKNDTIVHVVSAHDGQVPYFFVEFNAEWELGGTMTVSYSRSTGPVGADVPEGGLVKDSARTRVSVSLLDVKHSDTIIVAATFTANTLEAPSTTCQVSIQVKTTDAPAGLMTTVFETTDLDTQVASWVKDINYSSRDGWEELGGVSLGRFESWHTGYLKVDIAGDYTFYLSTDSRVQMYLDNEVIIDDDGVNSVTLKTSTKSLEPGLHEVKLHFSETQGVSFLLLEWLPPGAGESVIIPSTHLSSQLSPVRQGLTTRLYQTGTDMIDFPDFDSLHSVRNWTGFPLNFWWPRIGFTNNFAVLHDGYMTISVPGSYVFFLTSDGGSRMYFGGELLIDNSGLRTNGFVTKSANASLTPGQYAFRVEYFAHTSTYDWKSYLVIEWQRSGAKRKTVIPKESLSESPLTGHGILTAMYRAAPGSVMNDFPNFNSGTPVEYWTGAVDFGWPTKYGDNFASRHTGYLTVDVAGDYMFYLTSDDGSRMFLDGEEIIENGGIHGKITKNASRYLVPGQYEVRIEFFELANPGQHLKWQWQQPGEEIRVVPLERLVPLNCPTTDASGRCQLPPPLGMREQVYYTSYMLDRVFFVAYWFFPKFYLLTPATNGVVPVVQLEQSNYDYGNYAVRWSGYLTVSQVGTYKFKLGSVDSSRMFIDGVLIIDNGVDGTAHLLIGQHEVRVEFFRSSFNTQTLKLEWQQPGTSWETVPQARLNPLVCWTVDEAGRCEVGMHTAVYWAVLDSSTADFSDYESSTPVETWEGGRNAHLMDPPTSDRAIVGFSAFRQGGYLRVDVAGSYTLSLQSIGVSRMYLDGKLIISVGPPPSRNHVSTVEATVPLESGKYEVRVEYYAQSGYSHLSWKWARAGEALEVVPVEVLAPLYCRRTYDDGKCKPKAGMRTALYRADADNGEIMADFPNFETRAADEIWEDGRNVDFSNDDWSSAGYDNRFASRHSGYLVVEVAGTYTFFLTSDDGSRMFLDGEEIISNGGIHAAKTVEATVSLEARNYEVRIEFFEFQGGQILRWEWLQPGATDKVVVPLDVLLPLFCRKTHSRVDLAGKCESEEANNGFLPDDE